MPHNSIYNDQQGAHLVELPNSCFFVGAPFLAPICTPSVQASFPTHHLSDLILFSLDNNPKFQDAKNSATKKCEPFATTKWEHQPTPPQWNFLQIKKRWTHPTSWRCRRCRSQATCTVNNMDATKLCMALLRGCKRKGWGNFDVVPDVVLNNVAMGHIWKNWNFSKNCSSRKPTVGNYMLERSKKSEIWFLRPS